MSPSVKCCRGDVWTRCPPQGCPSQGDALLVPVGHLSQDALPRDARSGGMPSLGKKKTEKTNISRHVPHDEFPSWWGAHSGGRTVPKRCPFWWDAHSRGCQSQPRQKNTCQPRSCTPSLPQPFSCRGQTPRMDVGLFVGPFLSPLAPALVTPVPSPVLLFPQSQGEPSAPAGSGDGRCSFPVCRLVPPGAAPNARPRRHQPHRPGKFQHRRCCSQGAMVMGAAVVGMDRERRQEWLGWRRAQREKEGGLRGGDGRECREGGERWTDSSWRG